MHIGAANEGQQGAEVGGDAVYSNFCWTAAMVEWGSVQRGAQQEIRGGESFV